MVGGIVGGMVGGIVGGAVGGKQQRAWGRGVSQLGEAPLAKSEAPQMGLPLLTVHS